MRTHAVLWEHGRYSKIEVIVQHSCYVHRVHVQFERDIINMFAVYIMPKLIRYYHDYHGMCT